MTVIRVDPPLLRDSARSIQERGGQVGQVGSQVLNSTNNAPSYDGQFGPRVRAIGGEAQARAGSFANRLEQLSSQLRAKADAFEAVDNAGLTGPFGTGWPASLLDSRALYIQLAQWLQIPTYQLDNYIRLGSLLAAIQSPVVAATLLTMSNLPAVGWLGKTYFGLQLPWSSTPNLNPPITKIPPLPYAHFSERAYGTYNPDQEDLPPDLYGSGWRSYGDVYSVLGLENNTASNDKLGGYYGRVFVNDRTKQVVIAHRGTENATQPATWLKADSDVDDDLLLSNGFVPDQYTQSRAFADAVKTKLRADPMFAGAQIEHTGHSLGGMLADLNAMHDNTRAITFDNPGVAQILDQNRLEFAAGDRNNLLDYRSNPGLVHTLGDPSGYSMQIVTPRDVKLSEVTSSAIDQAVKTDQEIPMLEKVLLPEAASLQVFGSGSVQFINGVFTRTSTHHDINNIIEAMDPVTGFPKAHFPVQVDDASYGTFNLTDYEQGKIKGVIKGSTLSGE